jgi:hypothetical protein
MAVDSTEIRDLPLDLEEEDVWSAMGTPGREYPALASEVAQGIALARRLCRPKGLYRRLAVDNVRRNGVRFTDGTEVEGKFVAHLFNGAEEAVFILMTIGPSLERQVSQMFTEGDTVEAVVLDAVGSAAAMNLLTHVLRDIGEEMKDRGWHAGTCLSPGQAFWDVTGQETIFRVLSGDSIGVELLESSFLKPQKSQSAVVPMGPHLAVHGDGASSCRYCPATKCTLRREPQAALVAAPES